MDKPNDVPPEGCNAAPRHVGMTAADAMRKTKMDYSQTIDDLREIEMLDRAFVRANPPNHNWTVPVFIALIIVALLLLGLSLDVQATVDAVNEGM